MVVICYTERQENALCNCFTLLYRQTFPIVIVVRHSKENMSFICCAIVIRIDDTY